jgi:phosphoribosylformylglycinamidine (FGAM) synthase-like amidotransferase family enzyme
VLKIPIGHMEGNYFCDPGTLADLERSNRIAFRYCTPAGEVTSDANPNGSISCIAGVLSEDHNVLGMMPHPDRSSEAMLGSSDGLLLFASLVGAMTR